MANLPAGSEQRNPPLKHKLLFWLLLGTLTVMLAEVVSFSFPLPFFNVGGWLVVYPLYTLHVLVLAALVFLAKQVTLPMLYLSGAIIGMYEAYLTKVLWVPYWGQEWTLVVGGVYMMHAMTLVGYWHPVMAFLLPVLIGENLFTSSGETLAALPRSLRNALRTRAGAVVGVLIGLAYFGVRQGLNSPEPVQSLRSGLAAVIVVFVLATLWQHANREPGYTFRELLPNDRQTWILGVLLAGYYVGHFFIMRPDALPRTLAPHLTVWVMYAVLMTLLILHVRRSASASQDAPNPLKMFSPMGALLAGLLFPLLSAGTVMLKLGDPSFHHYLWKSIWYGEWAIGALLALWAVVSLIKPQKPEET